MVYSEGTAGDPQSTAVIELLGGRVVPVPWTAQSSGEQLVGGHGWLLGWSLRESTGSAAAVTELRDGTGTTGRLMGTSSVATSGSDTQTIGDIGWPFTVGLYLVAVSGSTTGVAWVRIPA